MDLVLAAAEGALLDQLPPAVRLVDLRAPRVLRSLVPLAGYLRRERPRVLVSSMGHANLIAIWAARLAGGVAPLIVTEHNTLSQETQRQTPAGRQALAASVAHVLPVGHHGRRRVARRRRRPGSHGRIAPGPGRGGLQPGDHPGHAGARPTGARPSLVRAGAAARHSRRRAPHADRRTSPHWCGRSPRSGAGGPRAWSFWGKGRTGPRWRPWYTSSAWRTTWRFPASRTTPWPTWRARRCSCSPPPGKDCPRS